MPHNFSKIKLPPRSRSFSGEIVLERRGGDMWDDLKKWIEHQNKLEQDWNDRIHAFEVIDKMKEIEEEYGVR